MIADSEYIVVVGGGAFGLSSAFYAAKQGFKVKVLDRYKLPSPDAATNDINKIIRADYGSDEIYQALGSKSIEIWKSWTDDCIRRTGNPIFHQTGVAYLSQSPTLDGFEKQSLEFILENGEKEYIDTDLNSITKLNKSKFPSGFINKKAGWGNSKLAIEYLILRCEEMGVEFITGDSGTFSEFMFSNDQNVSGIITIDGQQHKASKVIFACGSWSTALIPELDRVIKTSGQPIIHLKIPKTRMAEFSPPNFMVFTADITKTGFYGFPVNSQGILKIAHHGSGFYSSKKDLSDFRNNNIPKVALNAFRDFIQETFPVLNEFDIQSTRMCYYTDSHDGDFYICNSPTMNGVVYATGGSGHGFKFMPILGQIVMDVINKKTTKYTEKFKWRNSSGDLQSKDSARQNSMQEPQHFKERICDEDLKSTVSTK